MATFEIALVFKFTCNNMDYKFSSKIVCFITGFLFFKIFVNKLLLKKFGNKLEIIIMQQKTSDNFFIKILNMMEVRTNSYLNQFTKLES